MEGLRVDPSLLMMVTLNIKSRVGERERKKNVTSEDVVQNPRPFSFLFSAQVWMDLSNRMQI